VSLSIFENERMPLASFGLLSVKRDYDLDYSRPLPSIHGLLISEIEEPIKPVNRQKCLDVSLGLIMNLSRQQLDPVLNANNEWIIVSGQSQNRIGLSYDLSLSAIYALKNDQSLFLSPRFRQSPSDHLEDLPFNLSRMYVGMELAYRMAF